jgi:hypothetical protein
MKRRQIGPFPLPPKLHEPHPATEKYRKVQGAHEGTTDIIELVVRPSGTPGTLSVDVVFSAAGEASVMAALDVDDLRARREAVQSRRVLPETERPVREIGKMPSTLRSDRKDGREEDSPSHGERTRAHNGRGIVGECRNSYFRISPSGRTGVSWPCVSPVDCS